MWFDPEVVCAQLTDEELHVLAASSDGTRTRRHMEVLELEGI